MYFSISDFISSCTVFPWPQINKNLLPHPEPLIHRNRTPQSDMEEICPFFYRLFYDSSLSSQLICTQTQSYVLCFCLPSLFLPSLPEVFLLSLCSFHFLYPGNTSPQVCFRHSFSFFLSLLIPHAFPLFIHSFLPPSLLTVWFSEVMKGSVSLGLCEAVSGWCNYDGWSNFQRRLSPRGLNPPCFLSALMTF